MIDISAPPALPRAVVARRPAGSSGRRIAAIAAIAVAIAGLALTGCTGPIRSRLAGPPPPPPPPPPTIGKLASADVQSAFGAGGAFTEQVVGGKTYMVTLGTDGTASRTATGAKTPETGTWRAADPGYCAKWGKTSAETCYAVNRTAATTYDLLDSKGKVVAHLSM